MEKKNQDVPLVEEQYYIDKTESLEKGIAVFPSIYIEGAAASGKTTAVKMLLEHHPEVSTEIFQMDEFSERTEEFHERLKNLKQRIREDGSVWVVFENLPHPFPREEAGALAGFLYHMPPGCRGILVGRELPADELLGLLWRRKMICISQENLMFSRREVRELADRLKAPGDPDEIYEVTGGWPGCADLMLRMRKQREDEKREWRSAAELRQCPEIARYIKNEIFGSLSERERELVRRGAVCPWLNEDLCREVWGIPQPESLLENLTRKGILVHDRRRGNWKIVPLLMSEKKRDDAPGEKKDSGLWIRLGNWYEERGFIRETFWCLEKSGERESYKACAVRNYQKLPFLGLGYGCVMEWKEHIPEICYLRGMYAYGRQDFEGLEREIRWVRNQIREKRETGALKEGKGVREVEIYLNLTFVKPDISLEDWIGEVEKASETVNGNKYRLYGMLGSSCTYLCGMRDLTGLFTGPRREVNRIAKLWREVLGEKAWCRYRLARMDYYMETGRLDAVPAEDWELLGQNVEADSGEMCLAKLYLLCRLQMFYPEPETKVRVHKYEERLLREETPVCVKNAEAVMCLYSAWIGEMERMVQQLRDFVNEEEEEIREETYFAFCAKAKGYVLLGQYKKAGRILSKILPYLRERRQTRFLAEFLFCQAIVYWMEEERSQAVKFVVESFVVCGTGRYVEFYAGYGKAGKEVLEAYVEWMQGNFPEKWHRKKKYNYGNVQRMPQEDYLETILRRAKKNQKKGVGKTEYEEEDRLTLMELSVLQSIGRGKTNGEICSELNLKLPTVKSHVYSLYKKLGVNNRIQAMIRGKELGILK